MQVYGANAANLARTATPARRPGGTGFAVPSGESRATNAPVAAQTFGGIDALLALQGIEDPGERRRRAVKRGRSALDALEELKLGLLSGTLDPATLTRLEATAADLQGSSGDPHLDTVMAEIGLRVAVELAKAGIG